MSLERTPIGEGMEGRVWLVNDSIVKEFYQDVLTDEHVAWLQNNLQDPYFPEPTWSKNDDCWKCTYLNVPTTPVEQLSLEVVKRFFKFCLNRRCVCLNFKLSNIRARDGEIYFVDIGRDIRPFEIRYFRDSCARAYILATKGLSDPELAKRTKQLRNDQYLNEIPGFKEFYRELFEEWFEAYSRSWEPLTAAPTPQVVNYPNVTLMLKACAMESKSADFQIRHIESQLTSCGVKFAEIVLLIDSKSSDFLREHAPGDMDVLLGTARKLEDDGFIDRVLVSPLDLPTIHSTYQKWFSLTCDETHCIRNIPVFPQIWGFDQIRTRYLLQADLDVLLCCRDISHNYLEDMLDALRTEKVFCVGFNIPKVSGSPFQPYDAPEGAYCPEVRCGLLDLNRLQTQRPFPNSLVENRLKLTWYRSVEQYQVENGWRSLRGGDSRTYYIHPPNEQKSDLTDLERIMDIVEQDLSFLPSFLPA